MSDAEKLTATADALAGVQTFAEFLAGLATGDGEHEKAEEIREVQVPILKGYEDIYRAAASASED